MNATTNYQAKFDPTSPRILLNVIHSSSGKNYYGENKLMFIDIEQRK